MTIRVAFTGIGNRSLPKSMDRTNWLGWMNLVHESPHFELVAAHDPDAAGRNRVLDRGLLPAGRLYDRLEKMLDECLCDALFVTCPAEYHAGALRQCAERGLHLLVEKPFVTDIPEGIELAKAIEAKGLVSMVVQNWRFKEAGLALFEAVQSGKAGRIGHIFFNYVRNRENPSYPKYIFEEPFPLLYAMGIHHFDLFRFILKDEIETVSGHGFKPPWSMYQSWTGHSLRLKTKGGVEIIYTGTISSQNGGLPQELLVVEGENGTFTNNTDWFEPPLLFYPKGQKTPVDLTEKAGERSMRAQYDASDRFILENFRAAVAEGKPSACPAWDGLRSLAVVEAARKACETGREVNITALMTSA